MSSGLKRVRVRGFRSARDVTFLPGSLTALVGEANAGKSNLLWALWALLDPGGPALAPADASAGGRGEIRIEATLDDGRPLLLHASPPAPPRVRRRGAPPVVFVPSALRSDSLVAPSDATRPPAERAVSIFRLALAEQASALERHSATAPALSLLSAVESCCALGIEGVVFLIEEPELYLRPQAQRYLYRLLRALSSAGNQVIYSTHAPTFLNVGRLDELALVTQDPTLGSRVVQPPPLPADEEFRVASEFDAERSELFLARAALLVEGRTEKLVFPFVFQALGRDPDRDAISIVECGGKSNIPVFARICESTGVPFVAVHDRDAEAVQDPIPAERAVNDLIAAVAGPKRSVVLEPDFETVAGLHGHSHKPERAWRLFASLSPAEVPEPLARAAELALKLARA
jgi:hypothetical protein